MAGKKQHFIPQSLQRGFEARRTGTKTQVYVYPRGGESYITSTEGVGAERHFYSNPDQDGKGALDDQITTFELTELNQRLNLLRSIANGPVNTEDAAISVAHLTARAAHLRGTMRLMLDDAFSQMRAIITDTAAVRQFTGIDSTALESPLNKMLSEDLSTLGTGILSERERIILGRIITFRLRERFDYFFADAKNQLSDVLADSGSRVAKTVAKGHTKFLLGTLAPHERVCVLSGLNWRVMSVMGEELRFILPDCVALAYNGTDQKFEPFSFTANNDIVAVVMPLSSHQLLIGGSLETDLATLNEQFAKCSFKFFISSRQNHYTKQLSALIGDFTSAFSIDMLEEGLEPNAKPLPVSAASGRLQIRTPAGKFGDAARKALNTIARETLDTSLLDTIESVVVPSKLNAALEAVLHRPPTTVELSMASFGIATPIKNGKQWKCRIIVPREIAEALINNQVKERHVGAKRLTRMVLGRAYYIGCWVRQFPIIFENQHGQPWDHAKHKLAFNAATQYFGAAAALGDPSEPSMNAETCQQITANIVAGLHGLAQARNHFATHKNVDQLLAEVMVPLDAILGLVATLCGFAFAEQSNLNKDSSFGLILANADLWDWAVLFAKDLAGHYAKRDTWVSQLDLDQLASHAERLLWAIGVFVTPIEQGHWVDVWADDRLSLIQQALRQ